MLAGLNSAGASCQYQPLALAGQLCGVLDRAWSDPYSKAWRFRLGALAVAPVATAQRQNQAASGSSLRLPHTSQPTAVAPASQVAANRARHAESAAAGSAARHSQRR